MGTDSGDTVYLDNTGGPWRYVDSTYPGNTTITDTDINWTGTGNEIEKLELKLDKMCNLMRKAGLCVHCEDKLKCITTPKK